MDGDIYQTQFYSRIKPLRCPFSCIVPFHLRERNERVVENSSWRKHLTDREIKTRHAIPTEKRGKVLLFFSVREQTIVTISFFSFFFFYFFTRNPIPFTVKIPFKDVRKNARIARFSSEKNYFSDRGKRYRVSAMTL